LPAIFPRPSSAISADSRSRYSRHRLNACGILRNGPELAAALKLLRSCERRYNPDATRKDYEQRNIHLVAC